MFSKINEALWKLFNGERGQALAEYGLILGLIAVAAIIALGALGLALSDQLDSVTNALPGAGS
jgi:pilus assembly protein Flp/PilA